MTILLLGGTGKVGSAAARALAGSGESVRVLSRDPEAARLPPGVEAVAGDLGDAASLERAFAGVDRAALVPPLDPEEERLDLNAVRAAAAAGVERFVLLSIYGIDELPDAVHVTGKRAAERELRRLGVPGAVVLPNNYFQNDLAVRPVIAEHGVYPVPLGPVGCHSVDTGDVGEAIARLLTTDAGVGERVPVVGPDPVTGPAAAATWSSALGREVRYGGADLAAWAEGMRAHLPGWLVEALATMYGHFARHGLLASPAEVAASERLLGRPARRYADFVAAAAAS